MAEDPFVLCCREHGITDISFVSQYHSAKIYRGSYVSTQLSVGIKYLQRLDQVTCQQLLDEYQKYSSFQDFPNVVKVYETFAFQTNQDFSLVIVQEWLDKDLAKEIQYRSRTGNRWTDAEIMEMGKCLICALAVLQEQGVAHRDIKPQSIFMDHLMQVKIGDFGSSRRFENMEELNFLITITGTQFYMSPELKSLTYLCSDKGYYNPYKSDVYSLGLTMLTAYKLEEPMALVNPSTSTECVVAELSSINSSELRDLFTYMLATDSTNRPDFIQLRDFLLGPQVPVALEAGQLAQCPHLCEGGQNFYQFKCHGYFCVPCVTRVEQIKSPGNYPHFRAYCPVCSSPIEWKSYADLCGIHSEENPYETDCVKQEKRSDSMNYQLVCPRQDLKLRYSYSEEPPLSAQQPSEVQCLVYPCEQTANHVANPLFERNQIGMNYANPIPAAIVKSDADSFCIQCGTEMSTVSKTKSIVITCPEGHTMNYCARTCFIAHVESVTREYTRAFICFRCVIPINQETVIQFYGGMDAFTAERTKAAQREFMCVACKNILATHSLEDCGHIYCKKCAKTIRKLFPRTYTCTKCGKISHKKHNLRELPFWKNFKGKEEAKSANLI